MNYRKVVRDAVRAALSNTTTGFNSQLLALRSEYHIDPYTINWDIESRQTFQGFIDPERIDLSQIVEYPAIVLYTNSAVNLNRIKSHKFSGEVGAIVDLYLRFKEGIEVDDVESILDASEDALLEALDVAAWPGNVVYNKAFQVERDAITLLGEGWEQRISIQLAFEVHV